MIGFKYYREEDGVKSKRGGQDEKPINLVNVYISLMVQKCQRLAPSDNLPEVLIRFDTDLYRWFDPEALDDLFDLYRSELWL